MSQIIDHHTMNTHTHLQLFLAALLFISCDSLAQVGPANQGTAPQKLPNDPAIKPMVLLGTVSAAAGDEVHVTLDAGDHLPVAGDKADLFFKVPGLDDEVAVGSGTVTSADDVVTIVKFEKGTGKPQAGHIVRIHAVAPLLSTEGRSVHNAINLNIGCKLYAAEYGRFPTAFDALYQGKNKEQNPRDIAFLQDERVLRCPMLNDDTQIGYELRKVQNDGPGVQILFLSKAVSSKGNRIVAFTDGSLKLIPDGAPGQVPTAPPAAPAMPAAPLPATALKLQAAASVYTFESLTAGGVNLGGQDGWVHEGSAPFVVTADELANGTKVVGTNGSGSSNFVKRANNGTFSFGNLAGTSAIVLSFDGRYVGGGNDQIHFTLRNSSSTAVSPIFGFEGNNFRIGGTFATLPGSINPNDWVRMEMVIDMTAGSSSLSYQNITDGDTGFTAVAGLQNIGTAGLNPGAWTEMLVRTGFYANNKFDNLSIKGVP